MSQDQLPMAATQLCVALDSIPCLLLELIAVYWQCGQRYFCVLQAKYFTSKGLDQPETGMNC